MKFRLKPKCGDHLARNEQGEMITYKSGDVVESDRDLVAMFPRKFELVGGMTTAAGNVSIPDIPIKDKGKGGISGSSPEPLSFEKEEEKKKEKSKYGVDVTDEFPTAAKVKLTIFKKGSWFVVIDPGDGEVLNVKKLRKAEIEDFLGEYMEDDEDEDEDEGED